MEPASMPQYWLAVFEKGFADSFNFINQDRQGIAFGILVLLLTALWLTKKHGWRDAMSHWWRTAGEGVVITIVAWFVVLLFHLAWEPFHLQNDLAKNREQLQTTYNQSGNNLSSCKSSLAVEKSKVDLMGRRLDSQQQMMNLEQGTFNRCVVALADSNKPEPQEFILTHQEIAKSEYQSKEIVQFLILTNKPITPVKYLFQCKAPISSYQAHIMTAGGNQFQSQSKVENGTGGRIEIDSPPWTSKAPLLITLSSDEEDIQKMGCVFTPQP
jgi:hypothetical protein